MQRRGVRERVREALRADLTQAALELFDERGYAATTVEQIAARAGVTERTFFRHFAAKEDPVLLPIERLSEAAVARLAARPPEEPPVPALKAALGVAMEFALTDTAAMRTIMRLNASDPELRRRHVLKQAEWIDSLAAAMAKRLGRPEHDPAARLPCNLVMAAYGKALGLCAQEDRFPDLAREFDQALAEAAEMLS
jgi:AcrR family transcriptional regulator